MYSLILVVLLLYNNDKYIQCKYCSATGGGLLSESCNMYFIYIDGSWKIISSYNSDTIGFSLGSESGPLLYNLSIWWSVIYKIHQFYFKI